MLSTDQIQELLWSLRRVYREQNSYHNFQHAVDVLQATHHMLLTAGRVPPVSLLLGDGAAWTPNPDKVDPLVACLDPLDLFCLYVASIGHDVAHPGLTNAFMVRFRLVSSAYMHAHGKLLSKTRRCRWRNSTTANRRSRICTAPF